MRIYFLSLVVTFLVFYSWKDWYKALCGLIILMAFMERPDMPRAILGVPGLNPWNILFASIFLSYLATKSRDGLKWDMPRNITVYLIIYAGVIIIGFLREINDIDGIIEYQILQGVYEFKTRGSIFTDDIINTFKYAILGLLFFIGCRDEKRFSLGMGAIILLNILLAMQVIKWMPLSEITDGDALKTRSIRVLDREIGYFRSDLATMLAGAFWALYSYKAYFQKHSKSILIFGGCFILGLGMALTGGRIGMVAWLFVAVVLSYYRWRKLLLIGPIAVMMVVVLFPPVMERMTQGMTGGDGDYRAEELQSDYSSGDSDIDLFTVTAGRTAIWPFVIDKIAEAPLIGHGRRAMVRTDVSSYLLSEFGESFPHPHNAYLQLLMDNGVIFSLPIFIFFIVLLKYSLELFRDTSKPIYTAIGGASLSFILAQLIGSVGSQSFYPKEGMVSMWCIIGLMLRVHIERKKLMAGSADASRITSGTFFNR